MRGYTSKSLKETEHLAEKFLLTLSPKKKAIVVGLCGDLGSGKTAFVKMVAKILGVKGHVTSPTFVIQKNYSLKEKNFSTLAHIDAYRLKEGEDLLSLSWNDTLEGNNLVFIEWPERVLSALPKGIKKIYFEFIDDTTRNIRF
ncbi:MAG: tRNA (adenosine(37)-N6)-threonylcarbamoyltransferase complex ATPase subunit type 1 TsaE [Patescibacteria group bacterium]|nr:tRNA (adenosine(37)-N6)-threonylcarbamoyltransferase complex ATPase subunit type 1 TsaE [bacterium]MDZ4240976.1 tRNA (adenosine(37)-N6)-threonylcarbamoyltransferase complex ATPase subunit type 1 TsaE [Patescibacteria group bacterium]